MDAYEQTAEAIRAPLSATPDQKDLVRYATLSANSHNTQPWKFHLAPNRIDILPDFSRQTPVVDPDSHHLFTTLGCATENLAVAAAARGLRANASFDPAGEGFVAVSLEPSAPVESAAFAAIPARQMSRSVYNGAAVAPALLAELEAAARNDAVDIIVITDTTRVEAIMELVLAGNTAQFHSPAFMKELKEWIRFSSAEAVKDRDGLFAGCVGSPSIPEWFGDLVFNILANARKENEKYAAQIRSSAGLVIFVGKAADKAHWVEVGRTYQRFALEATARGLKHAFINQAVEVPPVREQLAADLGMPDRRPDLILRFGYGPEMPKSLRRPVEALLV